METYKREYCCCSCGLVWFDESPRQSGCPECDEYTVIYACDTLSFFYAEEDIKESLKARNRFIHYAQDHPYYNKTNA